MLWFAVWLTRRGVLMLREGTYYRTHIEGIFRWNRIYRYGAPVYAAAFSSIGGAAVMLLNAVTKLFIYPYPLEMPFLWRIPFEALWQGLPIPVLGYILAEWLYSRQRARKRILPRRPRTAQGADQDAEQEIRAVPLSTRRLEDDDPDEQTESAHEDAARSRTAER